MRTKRKTYWNGVEWTLQLNWTLYKLRAKQPSSSEVQVLALAFTSKYSTVTQQPVLLIVAFKQMHLQIGPRFEDRIQ